MGRHPIYGNFWKLVWQSSPLRHPPRHRGRFWDSQGFPKLLRKFNKINCNKSLDIAIIHGIIRIKRTKRKEAGIMEELTKYWDEYKKYLSNEDLDTLIFNATQERIERLDAKMEARLKG
jgi:hypothetical protein